jgi:site-specific recombinase XerD
MCQRKASPETVASYRDTFRLLVLFAQERLKKESAKLEIDDLDAPFIGAFLNHLENTRGNTAQTRNVRLAAIRSFYRYVLLEEPSHSALAQRVLAMPNKRFNSRIIEFLTSLEVDALLAAPDANTWSGRRDRALLLLAVQTGLRVSELIKLRCADIVFGTGAHVRCTGKGRKERCTPLRKEAASVLKAWLRERNCDPCKPLFPNARGDKLSRDGVAYILAKHVAVAGKQRASLMKKRVSPHVLRHTLAMELLQHGVDPCVIALWLGHENVASVQVYLHANMQLKEKAIAKAVPPAVKTGRYRPDDELLAFLNAL